MKVFRVSKKFVLILAVLLLIFPPSLLGAPGMARSAGAIWDLDESSGTRYDSATQGVGPAAQFTAANLEYLSIADNASLSLGSDSDFTVATWVYLDTSFESEPFWMKWNGVSFQSAEYLLRITAGKFLFRVGNNVSATDLSASSFGVVPTGSWVFAVAWHDALADAIKIQVNDGAIDSAAHSLGTFDGGGPLRIGYDSNNNIYLNGRISLVGFWKRVLTDAERTELYNSGKGYAYRDLSSGLKTSLQAYWNLNEAAGVRFDSQGSNDLTDNNTVTQATGVRGDNTLGRAATPYSAQFTAATSEYLSIVNNASLSTGDIDFTTCAWVYPDTDVDGVIVGKDDNGAGGTREWYLRRRSDTDAAQFFIYSSTNTENSLSSTATLNTGAWSFICAWHDATGNTLNIQVNNGTSNNNSTTIAPSGTTASFRAGANGSTPANFWNGRIALVGFWKKALSATERAHLYNGGKGLSYSELSRTLPSLTTSLNAYWNLYEASGTRADSAGSNNLTDNATVTQNAGVPRGTAGTLPQAAGRGKSSIAGQFTAANSEYISIPDNAALSLGTDTSFTIAVWVYLDSKIAVRALVSKGNTTAAGAMAYHLIYNDGTDRFRLQVGNGAGSQTVLDANTFGSPSTATWYFVSGWHDAGSDTINISINNGVANSAAHTIGTFDDTFELDIGKSGNQTAGFMDGRISKLGFWKKDLTSTERTDLYNSGRGNFYDGAAFYKDTAGTLKTSLQAWWELDELCCTRFDKVSPGVGPAAQFTAANLEFLSKSDNADLSAGDIDFALSAWVYLDSLGATRTIVNKGQAPTTDNTQEYFFYVSSTNLATMTVGNGATNQIIQATTFGALSANTWYFIVAWHNSVVDTLNIQVNGGAVDSVSYTGGSQDTIQAFQIGAHVNPLQWFMNGRIQNVGFWKRVLTDAERTQLYNSGSGRHCRDLNDQLRRKLISYWNLNEGSGTRYDCVGANDLTDNATVTQATGVSGGNSLGDNATVTHQQGLAWWTKARASGQFTAANSEYLSIADNADLSTGDIDFTVSAWMYFDSLGADRTIVSKWDLDARDYELLVDEAGTRFNFAVGNGGSVNIGGVSASNFGSPSTGTWYFVVAWHDSVNNVVGIQVNNATPNTSATTGPAGDSTQLFKISSERTAIPINYMNGRIDEVGFWKKVLTAQERTDLYNSGKANRYNGNSFEVDTSGTLTTSLTAYWTLDEASGTRQDSKGANHLTDNNTVTQNVGIDGTASGQFTAANSEYLSIPDNAALSTGDIDFTVGAWVYLDDVTAYHSIMHKGGAAGAGNREYELQMLDGTPDEIRFTLASRDVLTAPSLLAPVAAIWYFIVAWHDAAANQIYVQVNNGSVGSTPTTGVGVDTAGAFHVGAFENPATNFMNGRIDQVMFFKRVLTESERAALYNQGAGQSYGNLQRPFKIGGF